MEKEVNHTYETYYIMKAGMSESDVATIHQKVDNVIEKFKGKLMTRDDWGMRELAYPIDKQTNGHVSIAVYTGNPGVVEEIERHFRILEDVIRFLTVRMEDGYDYALVKKQITNSEEEVKRAREQRKKGDMGFGGGGRSFREYRE